MLKLPCFFAPSSWFQSRCRFRNCGVVLLAIVMSATAGCVTVDEHVRYSLHDPSPKLVHYRVSEKDELDIVLDDGTPLHLKVTAVDETSIHGKEGLAVLIEDISDLQCTSSTNLALATGGVVLYSGLMGLSVLALPAVPLLLMMDLDSVGHWYDDRLCRVTEHPEHYVYSESGASEQDDDIPTMQEILDEVAKRELTCNPEVRAERQCAYTATSGAEFAECAATQTVKEKAGFVRFDEWSDEALCRSHQQPEEYELFADLSFEQISAMATTISAEEQRRNLVCLDETIIE